MYTNRRLFLGSLPLLFLIGTTIIWGEAIGLALFLAHFGIEALPYAIATEALLSILFIAGLEQIKGYLNDAVIAVVICLIGLTLVFVGRAFALRDARFGYGLYYAAQRILHDVLLFYAWQYIASYYDNYTRSLLQRLQLSSRIGFALSGLGLSFFTLFLDIHQLIWLWLAGLVLSLAAIGIFADEFQGVPRIKISHRRTSSAGRDRLESAARSFVGSPLLRLLSLSAFGAAFALTLIFFKTTDVFWQTFPHEIALIRWLGVLNSLSSLLVIAIQYVALPRAVQNNHVQRVIEAFPAALGGALLIVLAVPVLVTALAAALTRSALLTSLYEPITHQIHNTLPNSIRLWGRTFLAGIISPLGRLLGGLFLIIVAALELPTWVVVVGGLGMVGLLGYAQHQVGKRYIEILNTSLAGNEYSFLRKSLHEQFGMDRNILEEMLSRLRQLRPDDRRILLIAEALAESGSEQGFQMLYNLWSACPVGFQAELLLILAGGWQNSHHIQQLKQLVSTALDSPEPMLRHAALRAMGLAPPLLDAFRAAHFLIDRDPKVSTAAAQLLLLHPSPILSRAARAELNWLSRAASARTRALAVAALVNGGVNRFGEWVVRLDIERFQADASAHVRMSIVPALNHEALLHRVQDVSPSVRQLALKQLKRRRWFSTRLIQQRLASARVQTPHNYQIRATLQYWHLLTALASVNPRLGRRHLLTELNLGLRQVDYLSSMGKTLQNLNYPSLAPIAAQLRHDRAQLLRAMLNFIGACYGSDQIRAITRALQMDTSENGAVLALAELTNKQVASQLNTLLTSQANDYPLVTSAHEWQPEKASDVVRVLLEQADDWFALISLYALSLLPYSVFQSLTADQPIEPLLDRCRHSPDDAIREGAWRLQGALRKSAERQYTADEFSLMLPQRMPEEGRPMLSTIERMLFLRNAAFFENLRLDQLRTLARICEELSVNEGEYILRKGEAGDSLFIVVEGEIKVFDPDAPLNAATLAMRGVGEVIGEISLFDGGLRSADAIATKPTLLLVVYRDMLDDALADDPGIALDMLRAMAQLVRASNTSLARLSSQISLRELSEDL